MAAPAGSSSSSSRPPFPEAGSSIGPSGRFFCLGKLGKGTFCSIHKCVDLASYHRDQPPSGPGHDRGAVVAGGDRDGGGDDGDDSSTEEGEIVAPQRIVAAKAELADFVDSGVIDGEASVLRFLDAALPGGMVPLYVDHVREPRGEPGPGGAGDGTGAGGGAASRRRSSWSTSRARTCTFCGTGTARPSPRTARGPTGGSRWRTRCTWRPTWCCRC